MSGERGTSIDEISTPWDDLFPADVDPSAQFYLDVIRIYLGLYAGTVTFEQALIEGERLKEHPEYVKYPTNPVLYPLNERLKERALENLETLNKYRIYTRDSIRSAMGFTFLREARPIAPLDLDVLKFLMKQPLVSLNEASKILGITPRTVSHAIRRLKPYNDIRFSCLMDPTAFNMNSYMLFFTLQNGVQWDDVIEALAAYPFARGILKISTSDLGYVSIIIPGIENDSIFRKSVRSLPKDIFDYVSLHQQETVCKTYNLSLFHNNEWRLLNLSDNFFDDNPDNNDEITSSISLACKGPRKNMGPNEFIIAYQLRVDSRAQPNSISTMLQAQGYDFDAKQIGNISRRLFRHEILAPTVSIGGLNLLTNYCFEIICNEEWTERLLARVSHLPTTSSFVSSRGLIVLAQVPSYHQVNYYQLFESLENQPGIERVGLIMTLAMMGSRPMSQLVKYWDYDSHNWSIHPQEIDIRNYLDDLTN
ncbi:MAG: winged helix-turn-helix domain-containing protein [Candidatus Thorarchaeota archaeon]